MDDNLKDFSYEEIEALLLERIRAIPEEDKEAAVRMLEYLAALPDGIVPNKEEMAELFKQFKHPN